MPQSETRRFKMHQQLLLDIIQRQAGSLWKASVEGVQNSVDSGSTRCDITCTQGMLIISDDGKGFRSKEEIEEFFEVFGQPHSVEEEKQFGRFRMGRGQLFAYGRNTWRSGEFEMIVDIQEDGLDYRLRTGLENYPGCTVTVELYKHLTHVEHADIIDQIKKNVKFVRIPIHLNGEDKTITKDRSKIEWDMELKEADIKFRENGPLEVYNQGVKVLTINRYRFGTGGDVVTKVPIKVNFARNDVMSDCPVWTKISSNIRTHVANTSVARDSSGNVVNSSSRRRPRARTQNATSQNTANRRSPITNDADRKRVATSMKDKDISTQYARAAKLHTLLQDQRHVTLRVLHGIGRGVVTLAPEGTRHWSYECRRIQDAKIAAVLDRVMLDRWNAKNGHQLVWIINKSYYDLGIHGYNLQYIDYDKTVEAMGKEHLILEEKELTRVERIVLEVLRAQMHAIQYAVRNSKGSRELFIGTGPLEHWTDGQTFIALNRKEVKQLGANYRVWNKYMMMILHEYCHDKPSTGKKHLHTKAFYSTMVDALDSWYLGNFPYECSHRMPRIAADVKRKLTRTELHGIDLQTDAKKAVDETCEDLGIPTEPPEMLPLPDPLRVATNQEGE